MTTMAIPAQGWPRRERVGSRTATNAVVATLAVLAITSYFVAEFRDCRHWCILPLSLIGIMTGTDLVAWLRRDVDVLDPKIPIAGIAFHGYYIAPLLHLAYGVYGEDWDNSIDDWRLRFGQMGLLIAVCWIGYVAAQRWVYKRSRPAKTVWTVNPQRFMTGLTWALLISGVAAVYLQVRYQGLSSEANLTFETASGIAQLAWLLMLGNPLIFLLALGIIQLMYDPQRTRAHSLLTVALLLGCFAVFQFMLVGTRGSRTSVFYPVYIAAAVVHYRLRRISITMALVGLVVLFFFVYFYGFYKKLGSAGFEALQGSEGRAAAEYESGHTMLGTLLGDFGRADVQAFLLYRILEHRDEYNLRLGRTYVHAVLAIVPRAIWPDKPAKVTNEAGTNLQYGEGVYDPETFNSSRVYGLPGEAILNFGLSGVPPAFIVFGLGMGWLRQRLRDWDPRDARFILVPFITLAFFNSIPGDADNTVFGLLSQGALPFLVVLNGARRLPRSASAISP